MKAVNTPGASWRSAAAMISAQASASAWRLETGSPKTLSPPLKAWPVSAEMLSAQ